MNLRTRLSAAAAAFRNAPPRGQPTERVQAGTFAQVMAGVSVTEESAMRYATVQACVRVLSEDVAATPMHLYRRLSNGGKERARDHPLYPLLHDLANPEMTAMAFKESMMVSLLLYGNAYAFIEWGGDGRPKGLWPVPGSRCRPRRAKSGKIVYDIGLNTYDAGQILHIPGLSYDGIMGLSPIAYARETIGLGQAAEQFGSYFFRNGTHLGGTIEIPGTLSEEAFARMEQQIKDLYSGLKMSHGVPLLEGGAKYVPNGIPPEDAQFLETRKYQRTEIAAIYRVPPHLINDLERATFSNIEHQDLAYLGRTLLPWFTRWEQGIGMQLLIPTERAEYFAEHDTGSFQRGDTASRMQSYALGIQNSILTPNEARAKENMNPIAGHDDLLIPLNMATARELQSEEQDARWSAHGSREQERRATPNAQRIAMRRIRIAERHKAGIAKAAQQLVENDCQQFRLALERLRESKDDTSFLEWLESHVETMKHSSQRALRDVLARLADAVRENAHQEIGIAQDTDRSYQDFVAGYARSMGIRYALDAKDAILLALQEGEEAPEGRVAAAEELVEGWLSARAMELATQEAVRVTGAVAQFVYRAAGLTAMWRVTDAKACPICQERNGIITQRHPPLHKGCTCTIVAGRAEGGDNE